MASTAAQFIDRKSPDAIDVLVVCLNDFNLYH